MDHSNTASKSHKEKVNFQHDLKDVKDSITHAASHVASQAREKTEELVDEAKEVTAEWQNKLITYVKKNPLAAIGYSVLAGFITALLIRK